MTEKPLPLLGGLAAFLHWLEELLNLISGPLLVAGLGIALVDLLTDGRLTATTPTLLYVWAVSQAVGVDAQLVGAFARARHALRTRRYWTLAGLLVLGVALAYVGWVAAQVFATEQAWHITTAQALARLGLNQTAWLIQRSALSVFLVALSGWTRYHPPAPATLADERARLERELELEPLRQRVRAQAALGAVGLVRQTVAAARGQEAAAPTYPPGLPLGALAGTLPPDPDPTGPGTPAIAAEATGTDGVLALPARREWGGPRQVRTPRAGKGGRPRGPIPESVEPKARRAWVPGMSVEALQEAAGISRASAMKYHGILSVEDGRRVRRAQ